MEYFFVFAQMGSANQMLVAIFPFILMFLVLYLLLIRPQRKKEEDRKKLIDAVKKGDRVVTIGGIYGKIVSAKEEELIIQIDPNKDVCVKFTRSAVARVVGSEKGGEQKGNGGSQ
jgi:preprotein translocase subunit YajC